MFATIGTIVLFLIVLSILVVIHELGHFFAARMFGVAVEEFGLGFPPRAAILKKGKETTYTINWLPFGGFVKLKGEGGESKEHDSFVAQSLWKRTIILGAGVFMNIAFTVLVFTIGYSVGMPQSVEGNANATSLKDFRIEVIAAKEGSPAQKAGIQSGDVITQIEGQIFSDVTSLRSYVGAHGGQELNVDIRRNGSSLPLKITPTILTQGEQAVMGVELVAVATVSYPIHIAFAESLKTTWALTKNIFTSLGSAVRTRDFGGFVGPVGIAKHTAQAAQLGLSYLINLMALISLSLGIFNVLPIPALDGGRILFVFIEKIRRRPIDQQLENTLHLVGFFVLLLLLVLITVKDVGSLLK